MSESIRTYTGVEFFPLDPKPETIDIRDIAHALSLQCRFAGHVQHFYSVAQHSVYVQELVRRVDGSKEMCRWALLHDAAEAYLTDVPRPIKHAEFGNAYRAAEDRLMQVIAKKYGLTYPEPKVVKWADTELLAAEMRDLFHPEYPAPWACRHETAWDTKVIPVSPATAESVFLYVFEGVA